MSMHCNRLSVTLLILLPAAGARAQTASIPSTAPTQAAASVPTAQPQENSATQSGPAKVTWNGAVLSVRASGQGLPTILREIARLTGMKVVGGAPGEPVFGTYGPGSVQAVMASLFDGMNVNMMLVNDSPTKPKELILTARTGGTTPPAPTQDVTVEASQPSTDPADANLAQPRPGRHTSPNSFQGAPSADGQQATGVPAGGIAPSLPLMENPNNTNGSTTPTTTDANGTPQSPNGVRTPEQIFEELRKRQQGASQ